MQARTGRSCGCDHHPTPSIASYARARARDHDRRTHRDDHDPSSAHGEVAGRGNSRARRFPPTHRLADLNFLAIVYRRNPDAVRDNPSLTDTPKVSGACLINAITFCDFFSSSQLLLKSQPPGTRDRNPRTGGY